VQTQTAVVCKTKLPGAAFAFEVQKRILWRTAKTGEIISREKCRSTEYFCETAECEKFARHSLLLNGTRAGAVFKREGKSRTYVAIEGCQKPLNPK
jgi:hypothetical protein